MKNIKRFEQYSPKEDTEEDRIFSPNQEKGEWWKKGKGNYNEKDHSIFAPNPKKGEDFDQEELDMLGELDDIANDMQNQDVEISDEMDEEKWTREELEREITEETEWYINKLIESGFSTDDITEAVRKCLFKK
jgi:hypothetical protein